MNRIVCFLFLSLACNFLMADQPFDELSIQYTGGSYDNETFEYRLMKPETIEPGKKYPLVLFLHGAGERGDDNTSQLKYFPTEMAGEANRKAFPCFVLAPQCRNEKKWVDVDWSDHEATAMPESPSDQMQAAIRMLERTIAEKPIDTSRVYLTGLSMGGYGSWDLTARHPEWFAAAIIVCGGGDDTQASKLVGLPIWVFHGDADSAVPVQRSRKMVAAIKDAGGKKIKYTELPGVDHNSWDHAYSQDAGAIKWMFEQAKAK
ncbi:alpha/beta hydrolase-fold protein [Novipirellula rosea]|uniref:Phospholipase/carboxylesterase/thioesterase domain-containing protein n=1 Tax=Novipirellula rosea TaxID=1031540 RepID=A0ABP8NRK8_9BACT